MGKAVVVGPICGTLTAERVLFGGGKAADVEGGTGAAGMIPPEVYPRRGVLGANRFGLVLGVNWAT